MSVALPRSRMVASHVWSFPLLALAVLQAGYFVWSSDPPLVRRVVAVALLAITFAEWWRPWLFARSPLWGRVVLAASSFANFIWAILSDGPSTDLQLLQASIAAGYVAFGFAAMLRASGMPNTKCSTMYAIFALALGAEHWLAVTTDLPTLGLRSKVEGSVVVSDAHDRTLGPRSTALSVFDTDPRTYFDDPASLRNTWRIQINDFGGDAALQVPDEPARTIRVRVGDAAITTPWGVQLAAKSIRVAKNEKYTASFRARATHPTAFAANLALDRPPWSALGFHREFFVDTSWKDFQFEFAASDSSDLAKFYFDIGMLRGTADLAHFSLRRSVTNERILPASTRPRLRYRINSLGCRGPDGSAGRVPGVTRVLVVGGATAFGIGLYEHDTFASQLGELAGAGRLEVINCGYLGADQKGALSFFQRVTRSYAPDFIIAAIALLDGTVIENERSEAARDRSRVVGRIFPGWSAFTKFTRVAATGWEFWTKDGLFQLSGSLAATRSAIVIVRTGRGREWDRLVADAATVAQANGIPLIDSGFAMLARHRPEDLMVNVREEHRPNDLAQRIAAETTVVSLGERLRGRI